MKIRKLAILPFSIHCLMYLAVVQPAAGVGNFRIIVLPDTQNESQYNSAMFTEQTQWIIDNKAGIAFVAHVGDVVNTCTSSTQYSNADAAMDLLDSGGVPYGVSPGNHDQPNSGACGSSSLYPSYFGTSRFTVKPYFRDGLDDYNHYFFFSAGGMDFIIIFLQYNPGTTQMNWANNLLATNSNRRGIVVSHAILNIDNSWLTYPPGEEIYNSLKGNSNLFLLLCGHMHGASDGEALRTENRPGMSPVHIILSDYQDISYGNGWLRILEFEPSSDNIYVTAYSPYIPSTGSSFSLTYNMPYLYGDIAGTGDCDVDGSDLSALIANLSLADIDEFAANFGESVCP